MLPQPAPYAHARRRYDHGHGASCVIRNHPQQRAPLPSARGGAAVAARAAAGAGELVVGIDLGTTNSAIARIQKGNPVCIPNADGDTLTPSIVGEQQRQAPRSWRRPAKTSP